MNRSPAPVIGRRTALGGIAATLMSSGFPVLAQRRAMEVVLPIAAGGAMDAAGRAVAQELSTKWQEPVVAVNKPGAGMVLGVRYLLEQPADGRTTMIGGLPMTAAQFRSGGAAFNADDLAPVAYLGWQGTVLYIRSTIPANTVAEFVEWGKSNPVTFASSGIGSSPHFGAEEFAALTGMKMTHVPYTGSGAFMPALQGGHVDAVFDAPSSRVHVRSGKLKALMFGGKDPIPDWPELPTAPAAGLPTFRSGTWYGYLVPAKTPQATIRKLNADINEALQTPAVQARLAQLGIVPSIGSPEEFGKLLKSEHDRIGQVIKARNIVIS